MSTVSAETREALLKALEMNWAHARHIETQRIALNLAYVGAMGAALAFVLNTSPAKPTASGFVVAAAIVLTLLCWGMTHKWNLEFVNQIRKADLCARALHVRPVDDADNGILHTFVGFLVKDKQITWLNVRGLFSVLYCGNLVLWITLAFFRELAAA